MATTVHCTRCKNSLNLTADLPGRSLKCPKCNKTIRVPVSGDPTPMSLPDDTADHNADDRKLVTFKDRVIQIIIPLGYILFVFVPLVLTIRYFMNMNKTEVAGQEETAKASPQRKPVEKKEPITPPKGIPTPVPKPKSRENPWRPPGGTDVTHADGKLTPKVETISPLPAPRDLWAELERLIAESRNPDAGVRRQAATSLGVFLDKKDNLLRRKAAVTLAEMGTDAEPALFALQHAEKDSDKEVQEFAKQALARWLETDRRSKQLQVWARGLKAKEPEDRIKALNKIAAFGADGIVVTDSVIEAMRDKEKAVQDAAVETLKKVNPNAEVITLCVIGLAARDAKTRIETLEKIKALGDKARIVSELVIDVMLDTGPGVQNAAFETLEQINNPIHSHVVTLFLGTPFQRRVILPMLAELGLDAECTIKLLLVMNERGKLGLFGDAKSHFDLLPTIAKIAPKNKRFATAVLNAIAAPNSAGEAIPMARRLAGLAQLDVIEASIEEKIAALQVATTDNHTLSQVFEKWEKLAPMDKRFTDAVLGCIVDPKPTPERLAAGIASLDAIDATNEQKVAALHAAISKDYTGSVVFEAFAKIAPKDKRFAAAVLAAVAAPNPHYDPAVRVKRLAGIAHLDVVDATLEDKLKALVAAMNDNGTIVQVFAALGQIAPKDRRFITAVLDSVAAPNPDSALAIRERRLAGIAQLNVIGATTKQKVDALESGLKDKGTLPIVIKTLAEYGVEAKFVLPALKELKTSSNESIRTAAIAAIAKIESAISEK
ncbi:MAG: hypothetical protein ACKODX_15675 [Gemmata sp.]